MSTYDKKELLQMHEDLLKGRVFMEKMHSAVSRGLIRSSFHSEYGEEAISVAIIDAMKDTDWFSGTHRNQTALIKRFDPYALIAELAAKADGVGKGTVYDFHCNDMKEDGARILVPHGTLGGALAQWTGFIWGRKMQGHTDEVVCACFGDGYASEGVVAEAYNLASLYKPNMVFCLVNNEWAMTVPLSKQTANANISERAIPYGLPTQIVDGNDLLESRKAMDKAIAMAREGKPNVVEFKTLRIMDHFLGQGNTYREDMDKVEDYKVNNDPVKRYQDYLLSNGVITQEEIDTMRAKFDEEFEAMLMRANEAPIVSKEEIIRKDFIYADPETGGDL